MSKPAPTLKAENERLREALEATTAALNSARLIMRDKDTRDLAGEVVELARAVLALAKGDGK